MPLWNEVKSQLLLPVSRRTSVMSTRNAPMLRRVPQRRNDTMNEQAKGMTGCYTGKRRDRKRIVRSQHRMKATFGDS